jgi:PilZ domain
MIDRRKDSRLSTHLRGLIKYGAAGQQMACSVDNLTSTGAGLHVGTTFGLPRVFQLSVDGEPQARHCRVIWTEGKRLGVSFE